jgi:hypothetical protein
MEITVINNQAAGTARVPCVDSTTLGPGETHVMPGRSSAEVSLQMAYANGNDVMVLAQIEGNDRAPLVCAMKKPADPAGGVGTLAACGFDLETEAAAAANVAPQMYLGVFEDAACTIPATTATLDTAATGTIDAGAGTSLLTVTPSAAGVVSVTLTDTADEVVYLKGWPVGTDYIVDSSDVHAPEFTA